MKKIVILGCENSHANSFLTYIRDNKEFSDVEVIGVYSIEREAAEKLHESFGVPVMENYDDAVGKVDGIVVTARHGGYHAKFALPYLPTVKAAFIDKPVTIDEEEAVELMRQCRRYGVKVSGGSCLKFVDEIRAIRDDVRAEANGKTLTGAVRAPVSYENEHGGFFFYSEHLIAMLGEAFGWFPRSVIARRKGATTSILFRYPEYDVCGLYTEGYYKYTVSRHSEGAMRHEEFPIQTGGPCFLAEFCEFYDTLSGKTPEYTEEELIAPVFTLNAIVRALESGHEEEVRTFTI